MNDVTDDSGVSVESPEAEELRRRIKELEDRLASVDRPGRPTKSSGGSNLTTVLLALLGGMSALMAWPAFLTVRRWVRWWRE